jgi:hypothetical protein
LLLFLSLVYIPFLSLGNLDLLVGFHSKLYQLFFASTYFLIASPRNKSSKKYTLFSLFNRTPNPLAGNVRQFIVVTAPLATLKMSMEPSLIPY